ncbi:MAG: outer membrane protein assembly factor BamB [Planctomycetota bacterium]|jgi:outer membrane protein assembly factor BamB
MKTARLLLVLSLLVGLTNAQSLRLDASGAFFTERAAGTDSEAAATTSKGVISNDSFTSYAGDRKSPRVLENLAFDYLLARECEAKGVARTATMLARSMAMRFSLESQQSPTGAAIGGSLARYATDQLRDLRIRELVGARRSIDEESLLARFHHRYGQDGVRVRVRHILSTDERSKPLTAQQHAQALRARLQNGASFDELLKLSHDRLTRRLLRDPRRRADAGVLAGYNYNRYGDAFTAMVRSLEIGAISQPVTSETGSHLVQVLARKVTLLRSVAPSLRLELGGGKARSSEILTLRRELLRKYAFQANYQFAAATKVRVVARANIAPAIATPTEWPHYRGNPQLQGEAPGRIGSKPTLAWTYATKDEILSSPAIADGLVFIGSTDNSVYAIDQVTGVKRWSYATQDMVEAPALVLDGRVYIGSSDGFLYALDAKTGKLAWKFETQDKILGGANWFTAKNGETRIVVGSYDANVYCLDDSGNKMWAYETDNYVNGTPAIYNGEIVFGGCDAGLHLVNVETGVRVNKVELGSGCQVAGSVALYKGKAYFGHYGNEFLSVDLTSGAIDWRYASKRDGFVSSPALNDTYVVFGGRDKNLHCVLRKDGTPQWKFQTRRKVDASPVITGDKVVFGSGDGRLYLLSLKDGKELWNYDVGKAIYSSPAVVNGLIVVGTGDHRVYAFHVPVTSK